MTKVKAVVVVVLLVGGGGAGALLGLNGFYQARLDSQVQCALAGADQQFVEHLRVEAFRAIERLSRESQNPDLLTALAKVRPVTADSEIEAVKSAMKSSHDDLLPLLEKLHKQAKSVSLLAISADGRVAAKFPDRDNYGESLKGLPAVGECLGGISRDGFYEIGGKPYSVAVTPVIDSRNKVAGCLMSADELDGADFATLAKDTGLEAAVFLRKTIVASTMERNALEPLISLLNSSDVIRFGDLPESPLLVDFSGKGFAARSVSLKGGTDALHLAVILPLASMVAPLKEAQMTLLMGIGALLIVGLLLGFILSAKSDTREAERLRDAVRNLTDGSTSVLSVTGYSGVYQDLAQSIGNLASAGPRPVSATAGGSHAANNGLGLQSPLESEPPEAPEPSDLDFESLLGGASKSPAPAEPQPQAPEAPAAATQPEPPPAEAASPELPAELFAQAEPEPEAPDPATPPAEISSPGGPRVELPGELAGMFDEETVEASATHQAPEPPAAPTPPAPPSIPPDPPDLGEEPDQITSSDYRPDATVIAQVPEELLKAAFTMEQQNVAAPAPAAPAASPIRAVEESPEDAHFREVFQQFVDTKKQCGESTVGLTFDRFAEKLRKNTADLKSRYKCRTVKFHVYVKNGKAALKATPLK